MGKFVYFCKKIMITIMRHLVITLMLLSALLPVSAQKIHLYQGNSTYTSDILYTYDGRHLYQGNSTYTSDILLTYDGRHLYRGNSTYTSDILYTYDGPIPVAILMLLL